MNPEAMTLQQMLTYLRKHNLQVRFIAGGFCGDWWLAATGEQTHIEVQIEAHNVQAALLKIVKQIIQ